MKKEREKDPGPEGAEAERGKDGEQVRSDVDRDAG